MADHVIHCGMNFFFSFTHTSEALSRVLMECFMDWNIDNKLSTVTVDNCTTNDSIIDHLLGNLNISSLMLEGKLFHMRCCAHILNLIVREGLSLIGDGIGRVRDSVAFWVASPKRDQTFREITRQLQISSTKKLVLDCQTRWNSTYLMLSVALIYKDVFDHLKNREPLYRCLPTQSDWEIAKVVCEKLELFYNVIEMFSGTKYPTANIFFPLICEIRLSLRMWLASPNEFVKTMASSMILKFDKCWVIIHGVMGVATVLDPRYKLKLLNYFFPKLYGDTASQEIARIRELCNDLLEEYQAKYISNRKNCGQDRNEIDSSSSHTSKKMNSRAPKWMEGYISYLNEEEGEMVKSELDQYLEEKVLPNNDQFDILAWWKSSGLKYPTLQMIARDILAIPISTVASESAFSIGGRVVTPQRSKLLPDTLEALMCGQNWLWKDIEELCKDDKDTLLRTADADSDTNEVEENVEASRAT